MLKDIKCLFNSVRAAYSYMNKKDVCSSPPTFLWIETTNKCNLKCIMCPNSIKRKKKTGFMSWDLFKKIIDESSSFINGANLFLGGEPLLHDDIFKMIRYAEDSGIRIRIHTNATLLSEEKSYKLLKSGVDFVSFSFDGYDKESYEKIRINADFDTTLKNVINFLKIKAKLKVKKPYTVLQSIKVHNGENRQEKLKREEFFRNFDNLPLDEIVVMDALAWGGKFYGTNNFTYKPYGARYSPCPFIWGTMSILWDGAVVPCCVDVFGEYILGDATEKPLIEIWNNSPMLSLRNRMINKRYQDIKLCEKCDLIWSNKIMLGMSPSFFKMVNLSSIENLAGYKFARLTEKCLALAFKKL